MPSSRLSNFSTKTELVSRRCRDSLEGSLLGMRRSDVNGSVRSVVLIAILTLALAGALGFGLWANSGKMDYKNNVDTKIAAAVAEAQKIQAAELELKFNEQAKSPTRTYQSAVSSGSVGFSYPNTWSAYVEQDNASQPINGYFHPHQVPGVRSESTYALRIEMVSTDYSQVVNGFSTKTKDGSLSAAAYIPPKMQGLANVQPGTKLDGALDDKKTGST